MYAKINNGTVEQYPYDIGLLYSDNPNTSFPKKLSESVLNAWGVFSVEYQAQPEYDERTQRVEHSAEPVLIDGEWVISKTVVSLTSEQQIDYQTRVDNKAAKSVRTKRDSLLAETDWYGLSDVTMPAEIATYRQALRDMPDQDDFPHEVNWPTKPE